MGLGPGQASSRRLSLSKPRIPISRSDITLMAPEVFDAMMASLDVPDESAELAALSKLQRHLGR